MIGIKLTSTHVLLIAVIALSSALFFSIRNGMYQKEEKLRERANFESAINSHEADSVKVAVYTYETKLQLKEHIEQNKVLSDLVDEQNISIRNMKSVISQSHQHIDTSTTIIPLRPVLNPEVIPSMYEFTDSTECFIIKGVVTDDIDGLAVTILSREFNSNTAIVLGYGRHEWKFLGIRTRVLGKRYTTATAVTDCGITKTEIINRKEK